VNLDQYYQRCDALQQQWAGKRVRLNDHSDNGPLEGLTGRLRPSEDCLDMILDQPLPSDCYDLAEDVDAGRLSFDEDARFEEVAEDYPLHSGRAAPSHQA
jgi:hypothetical protein